MDDKRRRALLHEALGPAQWGPTYQVLGHELARMRDRHSLNTEEFGVFLGDVLSFMMALRASNLTSLSILDVKPKAPLDRG